MNFYLVYIIVFLSFGLTSSFSIYQNSIKMKKGLLVIAFLCALKANAQSYDISFTGTGAANNVSTIKVENLTAGTSLTLTGDDILRLTVTTGINFVNEQSSDLKIYPNPMTDKAKLLISPPVSGYAIVTVYDIAGRQLTQLKSFIENYNQEFALSGFKNGIYIVNVRGNNYQFSEKLICNGESDGTINIEKISANLQSTDIKKSEKDYKGIRGTVEMEYTTGDRLKLTGISGIYSTVVTDIPEANKTITFNFIPCTDGDGINYPIVQIGSTKGTTGNLDPEANKGVQIWMAENLRTTKYLDGDLIGSTSPPTLNISGELEPKYQWAYEGNEDNVTDYGRLYTWHAISDSRGLCPDGWHIPTDADWTILTDYLGGELVAGGKLKETGFAHWETYFDLATNETGFTALPGGSRSSTGTFLQMRYFGSCWSATEYDASSAWYRIMEFLSSSVTRDYMAFTKKDGLSIRCVKD